MAANIAWFNDIHKEVANLYIENDWEAIVSTKLSGSCAHYAESCRQRHLYND